MEENQKNIPKGWELDNLGKVVSFSTGKKDVNQGNPEGEYPFFTCSKTFTFSDEYSFDEEALMIAGNGDVGTVHYYKGKFEAYQRTYVLRDFKLDVQYLFQLLKSELIPHLLSGQSGTTIQFIKIGQLSNFQFLKPKSKTEQTQIATILSKVDEAITQTEQLIAKYTRIKTGLMQDLLTKGIDENGNIRSEETHEFKDSPLGRIPKEWQCLTIGDIAERLRSGVTPRGGSEVYQKEGIMLIRSQNVYSYGFKLDDIAYISEEINLRMLGSQLQKFDVLLNITGASIGRSTYVPENHPMSNVNQHVCSIRLKDTSLEKAIYLSSFLNSVYGQNQIQQNNAGSNREGINYNQIRAILIPWFKREDEFENFKNIITKTNDKITALQIQLSKLQSLKTGLMQDLLSGKVRVNHLMKEKVSV